MTSKLECLVECIRRCGFDVSRDELAIALRIIEPLVAAAIVESILSRGAHSGGGGGCSEDGDHGACSSGSPAVGRARYRGAVQQRARANTDHGPSGDTGDGRVGLPANREPDHNQ